MKLLAIILTVPLQLATCQQGTGRLPIDAQFPDVPKDIKVCAQRGVAKIPDRDLAADETESTWKGDRLTTVEVRQCLRRLIIRDQKLAGPRKI